MQLTGQAEIDSRFTGSWLKLEPAAEGTGCEFVNGIVGGAVTTGTITTAGVFTAPALLSTALTVTVTATWSGDSSKSASSTVTLNPAPVQAQQSSGGGGGGGGAFGGLELFGLAAAALLRRGRVRRAATGA